MEDENNLEFQRGLLTRRMEAGENIVMQTDRAAVLRNVDVPKAQYHFVVLPKEDIENVTALTREHLPLLDHMMELANRTIEQQDHLASSNFLIGFKMESFMNRLNMHVISNDFHAESMRRVQHWNTFNSDLFITFQAVYAALNFNGSIEPLPPDTADKLRVAMPIHCNQCKFITGNFFKFKDHLHFHWQRREKERLYQKTLTNLSASFGNMNMNGNLNSRGMHRPRPGPRSQFFVAQQQRPGILGAPPSWPRFAYPRPLQKCNNNTKTYSPQSAGSKSTNENGTNT